MDYLYVCMSAIFYESYKILCFLEFSRLRIDECHTLQVYVYCYCIL